MKVFIRLIFSLFIFPNIYLTSLEQEFRFNPSINQYSPKDKNSLSDECEKFINNFHNGMAVTLFDAKPFLAYEPVQFFDKNGDAKQSIYFEKVHQELRDYYARTHQRGGFEELEAAARQTAFLSLIQNTKQLKELNRRLCLGTDTWQMRKYIKFCTDVINDIKLKSDEQPSIHGHPRDLFNVNDIKILKAIMRNRFYPSKIERKAYSNEAKKIRLEARNTFDLIMNKMKEANQELEKFSSFFASLGNLDTKKIKKASHLSANEVNIILDAKTCLMHLHLTVGRNFEMSLLMNSSGIDEAYRKGLRKLIDLTDMHDESINLALLRRIRNEHEQASTHPRVAIEGGGPTGLLMALTQFQAGAEVTLFEKRSTFYDRTQVVRLDPIWMSILKFYLGEEYYTLFEGEGHRGIIREDAFGEIATAFLEESLHYQLTKLISMIAQDKNSIPKLERLAAYEMTHVQGPQETGRKFQIIASYIKEADPMLIIAGDNADQTHGSSTNQIVREIDILICSGGKSSPMKELFLPSSIAVTEQQYYGVSSWLAQSIAGQPHHLAGGFIGQNCDQLNLFQDFRGMIFLDDAFRANYIDRLIGDFRSKDFEYIEEGLTEAVLDFLFNDERVDEFYIEGPLEPYVQTRTFENVGLIYIGMEVPAEFKHILGSLDRKLTKIVNDVSQEDKKYFNKQKDFIIKHFQLTWFQTIMIRYGLDESHGLTMDKLDKKFSTMFNVEQTRLHQDHFFSHIHKGESHLFVAAAGDANNSPHFMRYSGLTGAREDIFGLQKWTKGIAEQIAPEEQKLLEEQLRGDWERTAEFVISRGKAFLQPISEADIAERRQVKLGKILDLLAEKTANKLHNYQVVKEGKKDFFLRFGDSSEPIIPLSDGSFQMGTKNYESFAQIKLENDLN